MTILKSKLNRVSIKRTEGDYIILDLESISLNSFYGSTNNNCTNNVCDKAIRNNRNCTHIKCFDSGG